MIARLRGTLAGVGEDHAIIDVGGVGYLVTVAPATLERLPAVGEAVELHTELHMREDGISLYGFLEASDRAWFRLLQTVQGVGARVALSLLGTLRPHELANAIAASDKAALGRASGVGSRLAARIVSELKDRVGSLPQVAGPAAGVGAVAVASLGGPANDALSALLNLGYARVEAYAAIARVQARLGGDLPVDVMVREGLKELVA
jgi:Holliday junction DNA helicase RuvA